MKEIKVGDNLKNKHTDATWTVVKVETVRTGSKTYVVYEVANENFETMRFNNEYLIHYDIENFEEEE
tara:strand:- start:455 stop:655 length:201 start_codon:yes stop_codon:yes gene_type:complete